MVTFKDQISTDLSEVFYNTDEFAESITYTPKDKSPGATSIIPMDEDPSFSDPDILADMQTVRIQASFFTAYGAGVEPRRGDVLTWGGTEWTVTNKVGGGSHLGEWIIEITRSARRVIG